MRKFTWGEYYDSFYDWSVSTQKTYSYGLESYGPADQVLELATEFSFDDEKFASRFIGKALDAGVRFSPEQVLEMTLLVEKSVLSRAAELACADFSAEEMEELYMLIDDASFERISKKLNIDIFADDTPEDYTIVEDEELLEEDFEEDIYYVAPPRPKKPGFFTTLFAILIGIFSAGNSNKKHHNRKCNGDCANCPPHYGYRYGRWYYGHGHVSGCEFGGNKGDGSLPY